MGRAILTIAADTADLEAGLGRIQAKYRSVAASIASDSQRSENVRKSSEERAAAAVEASAEKQRKAAEKASEAQIKAALKSTEAQIKASERAAKKVEADAKAAQKAVESAEKAKVSAAEKGAIAQIRAIVQTRQAAELSAESRKRLESEVTNIVERESISRGLSAQQEANLRVRVEQRLTTQIVAEERKRSREIKRVQDQARQDAVNRGEGVGRMVNAGGQVVGGVAQAATAVHQVIQSQAARSAAHETALNDALIQTAPQGATEEEIAGNRAYVMTQTRTRHLDRDVAIEAIGAAQSFTNALGGPDAASRRSAIDATLSDVEYASLVNPNDVTGTVKFGALLRQQRGVSDSMRQNILRNSTGISFQGSVEQEDVMRRALPGMMQALNTSTRGLTNQTEIDRVTHDVLADFQAQLQVVAQSGGTVGVTANRVGSLRTALGNNFRAGRLRTALLHRHLTDAQRTEVTSAFTSDGHGNWRVNDAMAASPNQFARVLGHVFDDDPTAIRNFLGTHGGGGKQMLLARPVQDLIASYMGTTTDSHGRQVKQYDAIEDMRSQTLSPQQVEVLKGVRASERRRQLVDNANAEEDNVSRPSWQRGASDNAASWFSRNTLLATGASPILTAVAAATGTLLGIGTAGGGAIAAGAGGTVLGAVNAARGKDLEGHDISIFRRVMAVANPAGEGAREIGDYVMGSIFGLGRGGAAHGGASAGGAAVGTIPVHDQQLATSIDRLNGTLQNRPVVATVDPHTAAHHAAGQHGSRGAHH